MTTAQYQSTLSTLSDNMLHLIAFTAVLLIGVDGFVSAMIEFLLSPDLFLLSLMSVEKQAMKQLTQHKSAFHQ